jgi:vacuolar-type H+-ATPase subunit H
MDILHLIDQLEELVAQARRLPGGNLVLDRRRVLDLIDQMRLSIPRDVKEARAIMDNRESLMGAAQTDAQRIVEAAQQEASHRVSDTEVLHEAEQKAATLIAAAREESHRIVRDADATAAAHLSEAAEAATRQVDEADAYAHEVLSRLERQVGAFMKSIRAGIESIERQRDMEERSQTPLN